MKLFIKQPLKVSPIGRETKVLALVTGKVAKREKSKKILDMGTGTGYIAIYLAKLGFEVDAVDIDKEAVKTAKENAQTNKVKINAFVSDLFKNVKRTYDIITFNPPTGNISNIKTINFIKSLIKRKEFFRKVMGPTAHFLTKGGTLELVKEFVLEGKKHLNKKGKLLFYVNEVDIPKFKKFVEEKLREYKFFIIREKEKQIIELTKIN